MNTSTNNICTRKTWWILTQCTYIQHKISTKKCGQPINWKLTCTKKKSFLLLYTIYIFMKSHKMLTWKISLHITSFIVWKWKTDSRYKNIPHTKEKLWPYIHYQQVPYSASKLTWKATTHQSFNKKFGKATRVHLNVFWLLMKREKK